MRPRSATPSPSSTPRDSVPADGAVFGWEILTLGEVGMWALPGYGDFLERRTPGMRGGMADMGAPERFEDVVASVVPVPDDRPDVPAHWGVTFAVDDADAIAARATELGGQVIVPPVDATFTASKFVPENKDLPQGSDASTV